MGEDKHFVLVHGASHGAWCWYKVVTFLESAHHKVTALDLKASGKDSTRVTEVTSFLDYCDPLLTFFESLPETEKVILVGHSVSGHVVSAAMEKYPHKISVAVFLAASMDSPDKHQTTESIRQEQTDKHKQAASNYKLSGPTYEFLYENDVPVGMHLLPAYLKSAHYRLSPPEDYQLGKALWRFFPMIAQDNSEMVLTAENYGSVRRVFIVCDPDTSMWWQQSAIDANPPNEVIILPDSDHMAMFSKPRELVDQLKIVADKYE